MHTDQINKWLALLTNIGVLIGIVLLLVELNQDTELTRADIVAVRAEAKANRQMGMANSGEVVRILQTAYAAGFPSRPEGLAALTVEDRYRFGTFLAGLKEAIGNWHYQCQQRLLDEELCRSSFIFQVKGLVQMLHGINIGLGDMRESFVADVRRIAKEEGLPAPNKDGSRQTG